MIIFVITKGEKVTTQDGGKQKLKDMNTAEKVNLLNEYYQENNFYDDGIYDFDENTFKEIVSDPWEAMRSTAFGDVNFGHDYFTFNGSGNIETLSDWKINNLFDDSDFQDWAKEEGYIQADED